MPAVIFRHANSPIIYKKKKVDIMFSLFQIINISLISFKSTQIWRVSVFCTPTPFRHALTEWHLSCVAGDIWEPRLCNIERVLKYCFQMKKRAALSCHGNVWNVSHAPGKWTRIKVTTTPVIGNYFAFWSSCQKEGLMLSLFLPPAVHTV